MVDELFVTVGSIARSMIYGCSSGSGGEVGDATGWIMHFLKEISTEFVTSVGKERKSSIVKCCPIGHRCCNGMNDVQSSSQNCRSRLCLILRQTVVPNSRTVFKYWSDHWDILMSKLVSRISHFQLSHSHTTPVINLSLCPPSTPPTIYFS